ncbi:eb379b5a-9a6f-4ddf-af77-9a66a2d13625, partial [Thermothielavioides terrestris]
RDRGDNHLRLTVAQRGNDRGGDHLRSDDGLARVVAASLLGFAATRHHDDLDGIALGGPPAVIEVVEVAREATVEDGGAAEGERTVGAVREASRVQGTGLGRVVKLELCSMM